MERDRTPLDDGSGKAQVPTTAGQTRRRQTRARDAPLPLTTSAHSPAAANDTRSSSDRGGAMLPGVQPLSATARAALGLDGSEAPSVTSSRSLDKPPRQPRLGSNGQAPGALLAAGGAQSSAGGPAMRAQFTVRERGGTARCAPGRPSQPASKSIVATPQTIVAASPAARCHPHHLSHALTFLATKDFLSVTRACKAWLPMRVMQTSWPSQPSVSDLAASADLALRDPASVTMRFQSLNIRRRSGVSLLEALTTSAVWRRVPTLMVTSPEPERGLGPWRRDTTAVHAIQALAAHRHLTALGLCLAQPSNASVQSCFTAIAGQLRMLITSSTIALKYMPLLANGLRVLVIDWTNAMILDEDGDEVERYTESEFSEAEPTIQPALLRQMIGLHSLVIRGRGTTINSDHMIAIRYLSVHGQLRHLILDAPTTYVAYRALVLPLTEEDADLPPSLLESCEVTQFPASRTSFLRLLEQPALRSLRAPPAADLNKWLLNLGGGTLPDEGEHLDDARYDEFEDPLEFSDEVDDEEEMSDEHLILVTQRSQAIVAGFGRLHRLDSTFYAIDESLLTPLANCHQLTHLCLAQQTIFCCEACRDQMAFAFFDSPQLLSLATSLPLLQELRLVRCELTPDAWQQLRQLEQLRVLEVQESCTLTTHHQLRPLASLTHFSHLIVTLCPSAQLRLTADVLEVIAQSSSWLVLEVWTAVEEHCTDEALMEEWASDAGALPTDALHSVDLSSSRSMSRLLNFRVAHSQYHSKPADGAERANFVGCKLASPISYMIRHSDDIGQQLSWQSVGERLDISHAC